jgi:hypothetical protein
LDWGNQGHKKECVHLKFQPVKKVKIHAFKKKAFHNEATILSQYLDCCDMTAILKFANQCEALKIIDCFHCLKLDNA